ncbi:TPA: hypothetical protein DF272_03380 [Candidatus Falkowbacteria bacterium]|nr:hypothetical protein [Candidatus Falkowbacteria bacterium]
MSSIDRILANPALKKISFYLLFAVLEIGIFWFIASFITTHFPLLLLLALIGFLALLILVKLFKQPVNLLFLGLMTIYNPIYAYLVLTSWWRHGSVRVIISSAFLALFLIIYGAWSLREKKVRSATPLDKYLIFSGAVILLIGAASYLRGNSTKFILADIFPLIEFGAYFFFATVFIKTKKQLYHIIFGLIAWLLLIELAGVIIYIIDPSVFGYQADPGGIVVKRLADFMAAFTLPFIIVMYIFLPNKKTSPQNLLTGRKILFLLLAIIPILALLFSFFRSLWLGVIAALVVTFFTLIKRQVAWKMALLSAFTLISLFFIVDQMIIVPQRVFNGTSLYQLVHARVFAESVESNSIRGRFDDQKLMLKGFIEKPLIGYGFGAAPGTSNYFTALLFMVGLPAAIIICLPFYIIWLKAYTVYFSLTDSLDKGLMLAFIAMFTSIAVLLLSFPAVIHFPLFAYLGFFAASVYIIPKHTT